MIREAGLQDIPELFKMSILFLEESKIIETIPLNREDLYNWCIGLVKESNSIFILSLHDFVAAFLANTVPL